jgi:pSer/pThr/pTyr-binding forkhead associated (FHA) protein
MVNLDWILLGFRILTTAILYTFLGLAFYIIWRDLKQAEGQSASQPLTSHQLRVVASANDQGLVVGEALPLYPVTFLGRDPDNTIVLNDPSASGRHACISRENGVWWLEDLGSRNGTKLNELLLSKPTPLANYDLISIGNTQFRLESDRLAN